MASEELVNELKKVLRTIFQFDNYDLDFGIYRILNMKKKEITDFIENELFTIIENEIKTLHDSYDLKEKLSTLEKENEIEGHILDNIINFFSQYYDRGDFISKRRYSKQNSYLIPYNGEEVYLYWANNNQYYVKTRENLTNYAFNVKDLKVTFTLTSDEVEVEKGNAKDLERKFFVFQDLSFNQQKNFLTLKFVLRALTTSEEDMIKELIKKRSIKKEYVDKFNYLTICNRAELNFLPQLKEKHVLMNGELSKSEVLEWHLDKYTSKHTADYFIHKDLKGFLKQELDFYIINELIDSDNVSSIACLNLNIRSINIFKTISLKIIDFLAQIEEFQKKLWLKKKFVISTDYLITLDYIDEKFYREILTNEKQMDEWKKSYNFDPLMEEKEISKVDILKRQPTLVIDTKFFNASFKYEILSKIENLDDNTNGILINSDNFHALNLMLGKYIGKVKSIYIDPPYNAKSSEIIYKNNFKHSSWLTLMENRIRVAKEYLKENGVFIVAIDENEQEKLGLLLRDLFPDHQVTCVTVIHNPSGQQGQNFSFCHEYAYFVYPKKGRFIGMEVRQDNIDVRNLRDVTGEESLRESAKNCFYPIYVKNEEIIGFGDVCEDSYHPKSINITRADGTIEVYPVDPNNIERKWRFARQSIDRIKDQLKAHYIQNRKVWDIKRTKNVFNYKTVWTGSKYFANNYGTQLLNQILGANLFSYPKSIHTVYDSVKASLYNSDDNIVFDFFAGSGTTGHAVLKLNKEENSNVKFILVEIGQFFDSVLKQRIAKIIYSEKWKDGKPLDNDGSMKQIIKYQVLEQYEDSLFNIEISKPNLNVKNTKDNSIKYMLDSEIKSNNVFLNIDLLDNPFDYQLKIEQNNVPKVYSIDLMETFNYLMGINVQKIAAKKDEDIQYIFIKGQREDKVVLVVWRNKPKSFNLERDKEFVQQEIGDEEFDEILVNGTSLIKDAQSLDEIFIDKMFSDN